MPGWIKALLVLVAFLGTTVHLVLLRLAQVTFELSSRDGSYEVLHKSRILSELHTSNKGSRGSDASENLLQGIEDRSVMFSQGVYGSTAAHDAEFNLRIPSIGDVRLITEPKHVCSISEDQVEMPYLLVFVHSAYHNKESRDAVRDTWGRISKDFDSPTQIRVLFLLGVDLNEMPRNTAIEKESRMYRDILQGDFVDSYSNLTIKSLMGLQWARTRCPESKYVIKTDDDVYLNIRKVIGILQATPDLQILGSANTESHVMRSGLWNVEKERYPSTLYPKYCSGAAYALNMAHVPTLLGAMPHCPILPIEDVYVTGILAQKSGLTCAHHPDFPNWPTLPNVDNVCEYLRGRVVGIHALNYLKLYKTHGVSAGHECETQSGRDKVAAMLVVEEEAEEDL